jgi:uncharacterized protein (DUF433 family)
VAEQLFRKQQVIGSNPITGSPKSLNSSDISRATSQAGCGSFGFDSQIDSQTHAVSVAPEAGPDMRLEDYFEFLEPDEIRIKGHRVGIESILHKYLAGQPVEEITRQYDSLRAVDVYATITYYLENKDEVDAYLRRIDARIAEDMARSDANPAPVVERLRKLKAQRQAQQESRA